MSVADITLAYQPAERSLHGGKVGHLLFDQRQFPGCQGAGIAAGVCSVQMQQAADFRQGETKRLGAFDEAHALGYVGRIPPVAANRFGRFVEQPTSLVIADCLDVYAGGVRQLADGQFWRHTIFLDSVPSYGM